MFVGHLLYAVHCPGAGGQNGRRDRQTVSLMELPGKVAPPDVYLPVAPFALTSCIFISSDQRAAEHLGSVDHAADTRVDPGDVMRRLGDPPADGTGRRAHRTWEARVSLQQ